MYNKKAFIITKLVFIDGFESIKTKETVIKATKKWDCDVVLVVDQEKETLQVYNPFDLNENFGLYFPKEFVN